MNGTGFHLRNCRSRRIRFAVEPEGALYEIRPGDVVEIALIGDVRQAVELQVHEDEEGILLSIWPENGDYEIEGLYELGNG